MTDKNNEQHVAFGFRRVGEGEKQGLWAVRYRGMMVDVANVELAENVIAEARRRGMNVPDSPAIGRVKR